MSILAPAVEVGLPVQLNSFVGREPQVLSLAELLKTTRLLTLTGPGGAGKTRLAIEAANGSASLFDSIGWVELAPLADPDLVPSAAATALGVRADAGHSATASLTVQLGDRSVLLALDNCEHVLDAAATLTERVLKACPQVRILATSREPLGVPGEQTWPVPPLSVPAAVDRTPDAVMESEAGRLFLDRARATRPAFALDPECAGAVARICRRLEGIPLAIELAAARVRILAPHQIADRLDHGFDLLAGSGRPTAARHRALRDVIDWSHALLDAPEAALFRRLAVFAGTFSLDAVEAICSGAPIRPGTILDLLSALVDKSLVSLESVTGEARYGMLETIRSYAGERLAEAREAAEYRRRHATFFLNATNARERDTFGGGADRQWSAWLVAEEANLRAAADWAEGDPTGADTALRLLTTVHWHWFARGQFHEARRRVDAALRRADDGTPSARAKGLTAAAAIAFWLGDHRAIRDRIDPAVALLRALDEPWHLAYALTTQGHSLITTDPAAAENLLNEATDLARGLGPTVLLCFVLYWFGRNAMVRGDVVAAHQRFEECHRIGREIDNPAAIAHPLTMLGAMEVKRGDPTRATAYLGEGLRLHARFGDTLGSLWAVEGLARLEYRLERWETGARLLAAAAAERERIGAAWSEPERRGLESMKPELRVRLGPSFDTAWSEGLALPFGDAIDLALRVAGPPPSPPSPPVAPAVARPASSLVVSSLGVLRVVRDGVALQPDAWGSARSRELLLFLLCHPEGRTRERIGVAFWPDASTEQVRNNFHVTLHRLRKALGGHPWVSANGDRYALDPTVVVEFDALRFERDVGQATGTLARTGDEEPILAALAPYTGDFLEHETAGDWHLDLRDRLRRLHLEALSTLARHRLASGRWSDAADVLRRLIARDELHEAAYRDLMTCHSRLGERAEVDRLYRRLCRVLARELESDPEPETVELRRNLLAPNAPLGS